MIILGIETSCDETACAILSSCAKAPEDKQRITILSNVVASSAQLQAKYGGVIPEQAAREQIKSIIPVIQEALRQTFPDVIPARLAAKRANAGIQLIKSGSELDPRLRGDDVIGRIDAIAVTYGPGLIGSLLVGVETAKTLAFVWNKPLIPVNHLIGHFYANWITDHLPGVKAHLEGAIPQFPCVGLLVSGGHTDLVLFQDHGKYEYLGGTRDDASGECFDKCARLLGLPYPGGPAIAAAAAKCKIENLSRAKSRDVKLKINLPRPMINSKNWDFSFSGLKTAVANLLKEREETAKSQATKKCCVVERTNASMNVLHSGAKQTPSEPIGRASGFLCCDELANLSASIEAAIVEVLVDKTIKAAQTFKVNQIIIAGGVAANQKLAAELKLKIENLKLKINLHIPSANLCTDNAAMIAAAAFFNFHPIDPLTLQSDPNLALGS